MKIYFLPGMCVNCKVFDKITLPEGYEKFYIEWLPPSEEPFEEYVRQMAAPINTNEAFILAGYSMGGIVMQEMNRFLKPEKNILISSIKRKEEIPPLFRFAKKTQINQKIPKQLYQVNPRISRLCAQLILAMHPEGVEQCVAYTSADYLKWAIYHITEWEPEVDCPNLYHIHGTKDQIFPFKLIQNAFAVKGGDHQMILRKADEVSGIIAQILKSTPPTFF
jgi:surfactin synthase thioesterase subunit